MCDFSMLTWILLFLFVVVIFARQLTWMLLLRKIDCLKMTVREVCLAESRFRMSFKVGIAVSVLCGVPLLASMIWDMSQMGDRYILIVPNYLSVNADRTLLCSSKHGAG